MQHRPPQYAGFPRSQRLGLIVFLTVAAIIVGVTYYLRAQSAGKVYEAEGFAEAVAAFRAQQAEEAVETITPPPAESFSFDPNTVSQTDLVRLGLSEKQAKSWVKYRGDRKNAFRKAEDITKLYTLRPEQAEALLPLVQMEPSVAQNLEGQSIATSLPKEPKSKALNTTFPFDPNTLPSDSLQLLGLSERQANTLIKYRSYRDMTFRRPEDLYRVRALDSSLVTTLLPHVLIFEDLGADAGAKATVSAQEGTPGPSTYERTPKPPKTYSPVALNAADINEIGTLPRIGEFRARKIISYRDELGGFTNIEQVAEAYGIPDSIYQIIRPYLRIESSVRTLPINRATAEELRSHPYISYKLANVIVNYRERHGNFSGSGDLANIRILDEATRRKIEPYLSFE